MYNKYDIAGFRAFAGVTLKEIREAHPAEFWAEYCEYLAWLKLTGRKKGWHRKEKAE